MPRSSQIDICWSSNTDDALDTVERVWSTAGVPGQLSQDLPTPAHFEQAAALVRREDLTDEVIVGPDSERLLAEAREAIANGVTHLYFHQIGDDQELFCETWSSGLGDELRSMGRVESGVGG